MRIILKQLEIYKVCEFDSLTHGEGWQVYCVYNVCNKKKYRIYPKYWDTLSTYHTCAKI